MTNEYQARTDAAETEFTEAGNSRCNHEQGQGQRHKFCRRNHAYLCFIEMQEFDERANLQGHEHVGQVTDAVDGGKATQGSALIEVRTHGC